jgi:hypothetical protein
MGGMKGGAEGDRGWDDLSPLTRCSTHVPKEPHKSSLFWGVGCWAGCVLSLKLIEHLEFAFGKLLGKIEPEFVRNLKGLVDFEVRT